jgi:hypothetical protein
VRHQVVALGLVQALLDGAFDAHQTGAELVFGEFAHRTHATIAQVIDVIDFATAVAQFDQDAYHSDYVVIRQCADALDFIAADATIELHAAHGRQIVALLGIEQAVEKVLDGVLGRRFAGTHHAVDGDTREAH